MVDLKLGLIGTSAIGRTHIERINNKLQGAKVAAVSNAFAEAGKRVAENLALWFLAPYFGLSKPNFDACFMFSRRVDHSRLNIQLFSLSTMQ